MPITSADEKNNYGLYIGNTSSYMNNISKFVQHFNELHKIDIKKYNFSVFDTTKLTHTHERTNDPHTRTITNRRIKINLFVLSYYILSLLTVYYCNKLV